ncbi:MAG: hypothetical protein WKF70_01830 [Chitinophagaceae bacterium]
MLSNHDHIIINRQNYEAFFLLYLDGELTKEQSDIVTDFAALHPDLQQELDLLLATKLQPEVLVFSDKDSLLARNMAGGLADENLLLYVDNELSPDEILCTEKKINQDKAYRDQYRQLRATKLDGRERIAFPFKKDLYRSHQKRVSPFVWNLTAAAALLLLLAGSVFWFSTNSDLQQMPSQTVQSPLPTTDNLQREEQPNPVVVSKNQSNSLASGVTGKEVVGAKKNGIHRNRTTVRSTAASTIKKNQSRQPLLVANRYNNIAHNSPLPQPAIPAQPSNDIQQEQQQIINTEPVTTTASPAYNNTNALTTTDAEPGTDLASASRKGSVRGFLRKATRFIERRTGINPVNEDDELLIGVVAIKL